MFSVISTGKELAVMAVVMAAMERRLAKNCILLALARVEGLLFLPLGFCCSRERMNTFVDIRIGLYILR